MARLSVVGLSHRALEGEPTAGAMSRRRRPPRAQLRLAMEYSPALVAGGSAGSAPQVPGSKGAAGAWQRIASMFPPHSIYVEAFAGGAAVARNKRPAAVTLLIERDEETAATLAAAMRDRATVVCADALAVLRLEALPADAVLYCDPPYVMAARKSQAPIYRHEWSDADHAKFLGWIVGARCHVVVSGYWSKLYADALASWRHASFTVGTRRGRATEHVWANFPELAALHDTRHVGNGFGERQRIKRKAARWVRMLAAMPPAERAAVLEAIRASTIDTGGHDAGGKTS